MRKFVDVIYPEHRVRLIVQESDEDIEAVAIAASLVVAGLGPVATGSRYDLVTVGEATEERFTPIPNHPLCELVTVEAKTPDD